MFLFFLFVSGLIPGRVPRRIAAQVHGLTRRPGNRRAGVSALCRMFLIGCAGIVQRAGTKPPRLSSVGLQRREQFRVGVVKRVVRLAYLPRLAFADVVIRPMESHVFGCAHGLAFHRTEFDADSLTATPGPMPAVNVHGMDGQITSAVVRE